MTRKISAHYLFPVLSHPLKFGIVACNASGEISEIIDTKGVFRELESLEFYDGILVPGFVNQLNDCGRGVFDNLKNMFLVNPHLTLTEALKKELFSGFFEVGTTPGINLISPVDLTRMRLISGSRLRILSPQP